MTVTLGFIGMGYCGRQQLQAAASVKGLEVVALADPAPPGDLPGKYRVVRDWRELLEDRRIQAVSVCLPHDLHRDVVLAALEAGKHVLLEKPLAPRLDEARAIVEASRRSRLVVMVEMTHRFYPPVKAGRELVRSGRLGEVYAAEDRCVEQIAPERMAGWLFDRRRAGGGVAISDGVHLLDRVSWVTGQALRFRDGVAGYGQKLGDVEDTAAIFLSLSSGAPVSIFTSFQRRGGGYLDDELTIYGTEGTLRIWAWRGWRLETPDGKIEEHPGYPFGMELYGRVRLGMSGALAEFVAAIEEKRRPSPSPEEILPWQEVLDEYYSRAGAR